MKPTKGLPGAMRLTERSAKAVLNNGKRPGSGASASPVFLKVLTQSPACDGVRFACAVPKRLLKRAVDRNAVKRQVREAIRLNSVREQPLDLIVTLRRTIKPRVRAQRKSLRTYLDAQFASLVSVAGRNANPEVISAK